MKEEIITFVSFMTIFYLIGAFIGASFNINEWTMGLRGGVSIIGFALSMIFVLAVNESKNKE
jgi:small neutral amino acid transporter SnatA (MarC family)